MDEIAHVKKERFLQAVANIGSIAGAAKALSCSRTTHYTWLKTDPEYKARFDEAMRDACDLLEQEARRRAIVGVEEPVFRAAYNENGKQVGTEIAGTIRRYSDILLIFLLKGAMPEKYRERYDMKHEGKVVHIDWDSLCKANSEIEKGPDVLEAKILELEDQRVPDEDVGSGNGEAQAEVEVDEGN